MMNHYFLIFSGGFLLQSGLSAGLCLGFSIIGSAGGRLCHGGRVVSTGGGVQGDVLLQDLGTWGPTIEKGDCTWNK